MEDSLADRRSLLVDKLSKSSFVACNRVKFLYLTVLLICLLSHVASVEKVTACVGFWTVFCFDSDRRVQVNGLVLLDVNFHAAFVGHAC